MNLVGVGFDEAKGHVDVRHRVEAHVAYVSLRAASPKENPAFEVADDEIADITIMARGDSGDFAVALASVTAERLQMRSVCKSEVERASRNFLVLVHNGHYLGGAAVTPFVATHSQRTFFARWISVRAAVGFGVAIRNAIGTAVIFLVATLKHH